MTNQQYDLLLQNGMRTVTARFAVRQLSGRCFVEVAKVHGVGSVARHLVDQYGVTYAQQVTRKALKRRGVISRQNLIQI